MPGQDKTGPLGQGSLTGRGLGPCGAGARRGFGRNFCRGFGSRQFAQPVVLTADEEKKILESGLKELSSEKTEIEKRLKELK